MVRQDELEPKYQFTLVPNCVKLQIWYNSHKRFVRYRADKLSVWDNGWTHMDPENRMPLANNLPGGGIKTETGENEKSASE